MSTIEAPVATTASIMPNFTMSRYTCMQPPAEVEPARISHGEQALSSSAMLKMSAARAVSREEKLILRMASITGRASYWVMSTCSTVLASSSALALDLPDGAFMASVPLRVSRRF